MKKNTIKKISMTLAASSALFLSACNSGATSANSPTSLSSTSQKAATITGDLNHFDYTLGYQGGHGVVINLTKDSPLLTTKPYKAIIVTNFKPEKVAENCFSTNWGGVQSQTEAHGKVFYTTVTNFTTDWSGSEPKQIPAPLTLNAGCGLVGGNAVLGEGVTYGLVDTLMIGDTESDMTKVSLQTACADNDCKDPGNGKILSGYYAQWSMYDRKYPATSIPYQNLNEVIYAFIGFDKDSGNIFSLDTNADKQQMPVIAKARQQYPYLNAALSFGGWTNANKYTAPMFFDLTNSASKIEVFATQAVAAMRSGGYNGVDIDWEWWSNPELGTPSERMINLYQALRSKIDQASAEDGVKYRLSIAVSAAPDKIKQSEDAYKGFWAKTASLVDNINIMAYDMHGAFDSISDFQAPWDMEALSPNKETRYDIKDVISDYIANGVPASKLILGVPAYGRAMKLQSLDNYGLYQSLPTCSPDDSEAQCASKKAPSGEYQGAGENNTGVYDYKCIIGAAPCYSGSDMIKQLTYINTTNPLFYQLSSAAQQPWGYGDTATGKIFITYDDVNSVTYKTQQAKALGMGGMMVWELDGDSPVTETSLVANIKTLLNQ